MSDPILSLRGMAKHFGGLRAVDDVSFDSLSAIDNVLVAVEAQARNAAFGQKVARAEKMLDPVGYPSTMHNLPAGGIPIYYRKLLMIASALALKPRVLLMDEPASSLTGPEIDNMKQVILAIRGSGVTVVLIEHVLSLLMEVSDRLLVLGALYALMATGLSLVWTTLGIFNFAHGAFIALGAYVAWQFSSADAWGWPMALAIAMTCAVMFAVGALIHLVLVKPFERRADVVLIAVITTLAGSAILENELLLVWGPRSKQIEQLAGGEVALAGMRLATSEIILLALVLAILLGIGLFLRWSGPGRAMRAVSQNRESAQLLGLNVPFYFALAFGLSAVTAGLAGVFVGTIRFMNPAMRSEPLMNALIVVIFGGVARFSSPIYAAFIIGLLEAFSIYIVGLYWAPAVLFFTMIVVLLIKPEGLFGKHQRTL